MTQFVWDGDKLIAEYNGSGTLTQRYVHGVGTDEPVLWRDEVAGTRTWLNADRQGSIIATANQSGVTSAITYGPYGEPQTWSGPRFRYTGQIALPEAQLYYYKARVYDPKTGRFLQTDPIGQEADPNLYAYVRGDPENRSDPNGTQDAFLQGMGRGQEIQMACEGDMACMAREAKAQGREAAIRDLMMDSMER